MARHDGALDDQRNCGVCSMADKGSSAHLELAKRERERERERLENEGGRSKLEKIGLCRVFLPNVYQHGTAWHATLALKAGMACHVGVESWRGTFGILDESLNAV